MRIAFLDLPFHERIGSSRFFREFLNTMGTVDTHYIHFKEKHILRELIEADYDLYILWQLEPFVPFFVYHQCRVALVPMYDGCQGLGKGYWQAMRGARSINFSQALTEEQVDSGLQSLTLQYFPNPNDFRVQHDFSKGHALFWQRRPEQGLTAEFADIVLGDHVETVHVHNAPDSGFADQWPVMPRQTESRWSPDPDYFNRLMDQHNVFLAPRIAEGIGMAILEAMARGMFVIAADAPTANEYLTHGLNGYLFPIDFIRTPASLHFSMADAKRMGTLARETIENGYHRLRSRDDEVREFLSSIPRPKRPYIVSGREERLYLDAAIKFYARTRYFKRNIRLTLNYRLQKLGQTQVVAPFFSR